MIAEYKTIDEQIEILKSKKVLIKDEEKAKEILLRDGYFNLIEGYEDIFINIKKSKTSGKEVYDEETYFEEIYTVYKFDRDLRILMFKYVSIIETHIKAYISDVFSKKYGTENYLKKQNFKISMNRENAFKRLIKSMNDNVNCNLEYFPEIMNYKIQNGSIPFWMMTCLITFGNIVNFYSFMKPEDKVKVSSILNMDYNDMQSYLRMLNVVRNISAHGNVLFNVQFDIKYYCKSPDKYHDAFGIKKKAMTYEKGIDDMAAIIIILRRFLNDKEYNHMVTELIEMIEDVKQELDSQSFSNFLDKMGIPNEYKNMKKLKN